MARQRKRAFSGAGGGGGRQGRGLMQVDILDKNDKQYLIAN